MGPVPPVMVAWSAVEASRATTVNRSAYDRPKDARETVMTFPQSDRVVFEQNPLAEVICQLRFPTILRIASDAPSDFQQAIRDEYPVYAREQGFASPPELSALMARLPIGAPQESTAHNFTTADGSRTISLTATFLAVSERQYENWDAFSAELVRARIALEGVYAPAFYDRVGLRYQDVIDPVALGLGEVPWADLLDPALTGLLGVDGIRDAVTQSGGNALVSVEEVDGGQIRLQHGLARTDTGARVFVIDADLFTETRHEGAQVEQTLTRFNREAGNLFRWAIRPRLAEALGERAEDA